MDLSYIGIGAGKYNTTSGRSDREAGVKKLETNPNSIATLRITLRVMQQEYRELYNAHQKLEELFSGVELFDNQIQEHTDIMNNKINPEWLRIQKEIRERISTQAAVEAEKALKEKTIKNQNAAGSYTQTPTVGGAPQE
jgi:hemerythrin-like domain-containing protein